MATTERHNFQTWSAGFTQSDIILNDLLNQLETKLGLSVTDRTVAAQPGSPSAGECYILPSTPTGAAWGSWNENDIVIYQQGTWVRFVPIAGWPAWDEAAGEGLMFSGSAWVVINQTQTQNNFVATTNPTPTDDTSAGYSIGSVWVNVTEDIIWICVDATAATAIWDGAGSTRMYRHATTDPDAGFRAYAATNTGKAYLELVESANPITLWPNTAGFRIDYDGVDNYLRIKTAESTVETTRLSVVRSTGQVSFENYSFPTAAPTQIQRLANDGAGALEWSLNVNYQSGTSYTIQASDHDKHIIFTNGAAIAVTLPNSLADYFTCSIIQAGAGVPTVTPTSPDTINGAGTGVAPSGQYKALFLAQHIAATWVGVL